MNKMSFRLDRGVALFLSSCILFITLLCGIKAFQEGNRTVTVKGLSEREVLADTVIWPISFMVAGNDISSVYSTLNTHTSIILDFLKIRGISEDSIAVSAPNIIDKKAQAWSSNDNGLIRFSATQTITVYSNQVEHVVSLQPTLSELVKKGIILNQSDYRNQIQYQYTKLNDIKPNMIQDATKNARKAAIQFAHDSDSEVGKIKHATQGLFSIQDRDSHNPQFKTIRVVTMVEYFLVD